MWDKKLIVGVLFIMGGLLVANFLSGCATTQQIDTPQEKFTVAQGEYNLLLEMYLEFQDDVTKMNPSAHKAIKDSFKAGDIILDRWETHLSPDYDFSIDYAEWLQIKSDLIKFILEVANG